MSRATFTVAPQAPDLARIKAMSAVGLQTTFNACYGELKITIAKEIAYRHLKVPGVCQRCGCTDQDCSDCLEQTGVPCSWANEQRTLCSACLG